MHIFWLVLWSYQKTKTNIYLHNISFNSKENKGSRCWEAAVWVTHPIPMQLRDHPLSHLQDLFYHFPYNHQNSD